MFAVARHWCGGAGNVGTDIIAFDRIVAVGIYQDPKVSEAINHQPAHGTATGIDGEPAGAGSRPAAIDLDQQHCIGGTRGRYGVGLRARLGITIHRHRIINCFQHRGRADSELTIAGDVVVGIGSWDHEDAVLQPGRQGLERIVLIQIDGIELVAV